MAIFKILIKNLISYKVLAQDFTVSKMCVYVYASGFYFHISVGLRTTESILLSAVMSVINIIIFKEND